MASRNSSPILKFFYWIYGNISTIAASTFQPFPNLLLISLNSNKLVTIYGDLLQHTRELRKIHFRNNLIEHVGHHLLTDLNFADFRLNLCINALAETPEQIQVMNLQLPIQCPPIVCPRTCMIDEIMERILELERPDPNQETQEMKNRIEQLEKEMTHVRNEAQETEKQMRDEMKNMVEETQELNKMIVNLQKQLTNLENIVKR